MRKSNINVKSLRRSDLARETGCNLETIRYYENIGVMPEPPRTANNYRTYDARHVHRLKFVMRARDLGFNLEEVRGLLTLVDGGAQTCAEVQDIAEAHLAEVVSKIEDLLKIKATLSETLSKCSGSDIPECAVIDALAMETI